MKTAVLTLPFHTNYGGILQAYALKTILEDMGCSVDVIDKKEKYPLPYPHKYLTRTIKKILGNNKDREIFSELRLRKEYPYVVSSLQRFVNERITPRIVKSWKDIKAGEYEVLIVGSDQVWRPKYQENIEDAFLGFTRGWNVGRISYAASFGTDELEYERVELGRCSSLLSKFDAVSVREKSAVKLCSEWMNYHSAVHVLDPVMLLDSDRYKELATGRETPAKGCVLSMFLDTSPSKSSLAAVVSEYMGKSVYNVNLDSFDTKRPLSERKLPGMDTWLQYFEDADFVVTDSFHVCVLSILYKKQFVVVGNTSRGLSRFDSLLDMFSLKSRNVTEADGDAIKKVCSSPIDYKTISESLDRMRQNSHNFLISALKKVKDE